MRTRRACAANFCFRNFCINQGRLSDDQYVNIMVDHIRRSDTSVAGAFIYDNIPLRAESKRRFWPQKKNMNQFIALTCFAVCFCINKLERKKKITLGLSPENRAFIALPAGAVASKKKVHLWSPFLPMPPEGFMILTLPRLPYPPDTFLTRKPVHPGGPRRTSIAGGPRP